MYGGLAQVGFEDEVGVFECVSGEDGDHQGIAIEFACAGELAQRRQRGGRRGLAANAVAADHRLGLGNLFVADVHHETTRFANGAQRLLPGTRITDADGGRGGLWLFNRMQLVGIVAPQLRQRIGAGGLDDDEPGQTIDESGGVQLKQSFAKR